MAEKELTEAAGDGNKDHDSALLKAIGEEEDEESLKNAESLSPDETKSHHSKLLEEADFDDHMTPEPVKKDKRQSNTPKSTLKGLMEEADMEDELKDAMPKIDDDAPSSASFL